MSELVPWPDDLTRREKQIASLICDGKTRREICRELGIGPSTFDTHRYAAMVKLAVSNEVQLVRKSFARGWAALTEEERATGEAYRRAAAAARDAS